MKIVGQSNKQTEICDKFYYTFDSITSSRDLMEIMHRFIETGYVPQEFSIILEHDHTEMAMPILFNDINEMLSKVDELDYANIDSIHAAFERDGEKMAIEFSGPNVTFTYPLNRGKGLSL